MTVTEKRTDFERILLELTMVSTAANAAIRCFALADAASRESQRNDLVPESLEAQALAEVLSAANHANACWKLVRRLATEATGKSEANAVTEAPGAAVTEAGP